MATVGRSPGRGRGFVTFTWDSVPPGAKRTGYLAGDVHGLMCHVSKKTKPCLKQLCGAKSDCPLCDQHQPIDWCGYVPLRDHSGRPVCIIIRSAVADLVDKIERGARVLWGRGASKYDPVTLIEWKEGHPWERWWPHQKPTDDMVPWLCSFWRSPELLSALYSHFKGECQPVVTSPAPLPAALVDPATPRWVKGTADALTKAELGESLAEVFKRRGITEEAAKPNGKKKH